MIEKKNSTLVFNMTPYFLEIFYLTCEFPLFVNIFMLAYKIKGNVE